MTDTSSCFSVRTDVSVIPAGEPATRYVLLMLTAPEAPRAKVRQPVNVSFVLDRSGSMGGGKIRLAREAVKRALAMLRADDRFSLIVYDHEVDVLVPSVAASAEARRNAIARLEEVDARGNTDLSGGWQAGCEQVAPHLADEPHGRCLLLTDGLANEGVTDAGELAERAAALRRRHIVTSTFGVGADFDEELLQGLAEKSGGHFYFIEQPGQIPDLMTSELGEALEVAARSASVALQLPAGVRAEPLTRLEWCATDGGIRIALGDLVSRQEVEVVVRVDLPPVPAKQAVRARVTLADLDGALAVPAQEIAWTSGCAAAANRDRMVDRAVAAVYAARVRHEALALNRAGEYERARAVLERAARRIATYAGRDPEVLGIVRGLKADAERFGEMMDAMSRKASHFAVYAACQSRAPDGKARRRQ
jgi:Ca-activated chloride channel family protein